MGSVAVQGEQGLQRLWPRIEEVAQQVRTSFAVSGDQVRSVLSNAVAAVDLDLEAMADASRDTPPAQTTTASLQALSRFMARAKQIAGESLRRAPGPLASARSESLRSHKHRYRHVRWPRRTP